MHQLDLEALRGPLRLVRCTVCKMPFPCITAREKALAAARRRQP